MPRRLCGREELQEVYRPASRVALKPMGSAALQSQEPESFGLWLVGRIDGADGLGGDDEIVEVALLVLR